MHDALTLGQGCGVYAYFVNALAGQRTRETVRHTRHQFDMLAINIFKGDSQLPGDPKSHELLTRTRIEPRSDARVRRCKRVEVFPTTDLSAAHFRRTLERNHEGRPRGSNLRVGAQDFCQI